MYVHDEHCASVPSKHPWALGTHQTKIRGGRLHSEAYIQSNVRIIKKGGLVLAQIHVWAITRDITVF